VKNAEPNTPRLLEWPNYGSVSVGSQLVPNSRTIVAKSGTGTTKHERLWLALLAVVSMTACSTPSTNVFVKVEPPTELTAPCPPLSEISDVPRWILDTISAYEDCAAKHSRLVEAVR
jgi:hypothetical protein